MTPDDAAPSEPAPSTRPLGHAGAPLLTFGLCGVLAACFLGELALGQVPTRELGAPDLSTLVALGGVSNDLVLGHGEWHRMLTCALLHADPVHLALNCVALVMAGVLLEQVLGRAWLIALFVVGTLGGSVASVLLNDRFLVSIGASGAIMGLLAAAITISFRLPEGSERTQMQIGLARVLVPSLVPIATSHVEGKVDLGAHFGGAVVGALVGFALLKAWPRWRKEPPFLRVAQGVAGVGLLALGLSVAGVATHWDTYTRGLAGLGKDGLIPEAEVPRTDPDAVAQADALLAKYPKDPRALVFAAIKHESEGDLDATERALRQALDAPAILRVYFPDGRLEGFVRSFLAAILVDRGQRAEAVEVARPACHAAEDGKVPEDLARLGVCEP